MFRVVEDADGTTRIFRTSTNALLCTVNEQAARCRPSEPKSSYDSSRQSPKEAIGAPAWPVKKVKGSLVTTEAERVLIGRGFVPHAHHISSSKLGLHKDPWPYERHGPPTQEEFLGLLDLRPGGTRDGPPAGCPSAEQRPVAAYIPITCVRMQEQLRSKRLTDEDVATAVGMYEKCCSVRFLLRMPSFNGFPVVYRQPRHNRPCHVYCFGKEQRLDRCRYLATGLNGRARKLRAACRPAAVVVRRLTVAEIAMWKDGRLSRSALENIPRCLKPRCIVSDVRDLVSNGAVSQVLLSAEARAKLNAPDSAARRRSSSLSPWRLSRTTGKENIWRDVRPVTPVFGGL